MIKKLKMYCSGSDLDRVYFVVEKKNRFFDLFPKFLISCGINEIGVFTDYQNLRPEIGRIFNKVDRFFSPEYDIDLVYSSDKIFVLIRTFDYNRELLVDNFRKIASF